MSTAVIIAPQKTPSSGPGSKRKITPSSQQSQSKRAIVLTSPENIPVDPSADIGTEIPLDPFYVPKQGSTSTAVITTAYKRDKPITYCRNVWLPFNIRDPKVDILGKPIADLLRDLFRGIVEIVEGRYRSHLHFECREMPPTTWPFTVSGIPITIGSGSLDRGLLFPSLHRNRGNPAIQIYADLNGNKANFLQSHSTFRQIAARINTEFQKTSQKLEILSR
jgi:hypothetical protein